MNYSDKGEYMLDYDSELVREYQVPTEPKMFPLLVNGVLIEYGFEEIEQTESKCLFRRMVAEWTQFAEVFNFK